MRSGIRWSIVSLLLLIAFFALLFIFLRERQERLYDKEAYALAVHALVRKPQQRLTRQILSNDEPLIFVGGVPRSGTTLMRVMLDAHPDIRCGEETSVIPYVLGMRLHFESKGWIKALNGSGISQKALDDATSAFLLEVIREHGSVAKRLCNKDPFTAFHLPTLIRMFPNAKHILMIRDARATIHSMIDRNVPVSGFNHSDPESMFKAWNNLISRMVFTCSNAKGLCLKVYYERLVQRPSDEARRILHFLDVPWSDDVLSHQDKIGDEIHLNPKEFSTSQVKEKVNEKALTTWFGCYPEVLLKKIDRLAPMLRKLGYDTSTDRPDYSAFGRDDFYEYGYRL
uniref:Protein-tyrosine sulfotransferase n=1 Tax=Haemonchus contortus TaxID=6289 RepID=A0A7I4YB25_HAECO